MASDVQYEFEGFRLDPQRRVLSRRDADRVPISPRAFEALRFLVEHRGELVDKNALMAAVWPNVVIEDNSLSQCVSAIRRALGEPPGAGRYIATIPGRGYQFVAPVQVHGGARSESAPAIVRPTADAEAYDVYLRALSLCTRPTDANLLAAADLFTLAIERDPDFARAYLGLAHTQHLRAVFHFAPPSVIKECARNARTALGIDPKLAKGHVLLGAFSAHVGNWLEARRRFDAALAIDARDPEIALPYVMNSLVSPGHLHRAREALRDALATAPAFGAIASSLALVCVLRGDDAEAQRYANLAVSLGWAEHEMPLQDVTCQLAVRAGRFTEAAAVMRKNLPATVTAAGGTACIALVFEALGHPARRAAAVRALQALAASVAPANLDHTMRKRLISWYVQLGALESAFATAQRSLDHYAQFGTVGTVWDLLWLPELRPLRADKRFDAFCARLGLKAYWAEHGGPDEAESP